MDNAALKEMNSRREAKKPALAKQLAQRRRNRADGDVHAVERRIAPSRTQEAAKTKEVDRGPVRRWQPSSSLPGVPDLPDYSVKYCRIHGRRHGDFSNLVRCIQEGWEFVRKSDFPDIYLPTHNFPTHGECIGNDNTVLMKLHVELVAQRNAHYNKRRDLASKGVNQSQGLTEELHPAMPLVQDIVKSRVTWNRAKRKRSGADTEGGDED